MMDTWKMLTLLPHSHVGGVMLFNRLKYSESGWIGTRVSIFLTAAFDALLGIREGVFDPRFHHNLPGKENTTTPFDVPRTTTSSVSKKFMGKMSSYQAIQVLAPRFRLSGTFMPNNVNAGGCYLHP